MMTKLLRAAAFCCLLALSVLPAAADRGAFVITDFHADITVQEDATVIVEERIDVDFSEPRHGIYRTIPVRYTDPRGYAYSLGFRFLGAADQTNRPYGTSVSKSGRHVEIRLGDADTEVQGRVTYVLRYEVAHALVHFEDHDELYWNATGNEWRTSIQRASATVHLPGPVPPEELEVQAYTGPAGSREQAAITEQPTPSTVTFRTTGVLNPMEGLTIAVGWQPGLVNFPGTFQKALAFLADNWIAVAPLLALVWLWRSYRRSGRDPEAGGSVIVRYEPPAGMTPGEIGTLVDENVDLRDITATVVDLAVRGFLRIGNEKKSYLGGLWTSDETTFELLESPAGPSPTEHETLVLNALFSRGQQVSITDLKERFYKHIPGIKTALYQRLAAEDYFAGSPDAVRNKYRVFGVFAGVCTVALGAAWVWFQGGILPEGMLLPIVSGILTAAVFFAFAPAMPRRTKKGAGMREWAVGFEEFVDRVESSQLEADRERNVYETLLPYAMALGVAERWSQQFEGIYAAAGPSWYAGGYPMTGFSTRAFSNSLTSAMAQTGQAMTSSPRSQSSSGSGGGGFSGGGGGGGGGGSW
jgi:uncharacterized membrane protein